MLNYTGGGRVPGKEKIKGNSPKNDTVRIIASPGEIVLDKETIHKGPSAIIKKVQDELHKHIDQHFSDGGSVKKDYPRDPDDTSAWENIKKTFDDPFDKPGKPTSGKLDPKKAKEASRPYNEDLFFDGGTVTKKPWEMSDDELSQAASQSQDIAKNDLSQKKPWEMTDDELKKSTSVSQGSKKGGIPGFMQDNPTIARYTKAGMNALPTAGAIGGGLMASATGPGAIVGAGLGAAGGESLKQLGERYILGEEPKSLGENLKSVAQEGARGLVSETGAQLVGPSLKLAKNIPGVEKGLEMAGKGASKIGELLTGVPEKAIQTYAKNADEISAMAKSTDNNTFEAANQMRSDFGKSIDETRKGINEKIGNVLKGSEKRVGANPILDALRDAKTKINENLYPEQLDQIKDLENKVGKMVGEDGAMSVADAHEVKGFLQEKASSAYRSPGQPFSLGTEAARAAKSAGAKARGLINKAEPEVAGANEKLAKLHDIQDNMNMNLITEGKPEAGLISAGSGTNPRNLSQLKELGEATESDMASGAEKLAAMRHFGSPSLSAADTTGKAAVRHGMAGLLGYEAGHIPGAIAATVLTSPTSLKAAIDTGRFTAKMLQDPAVTRLMSSEMLRLAEDRLSQKDQRGGN